MANDDDYWEDFHKIQSLILDMLYDLDLKNFVPFLDVFPENVGKEYKKITRAKMNMNLFKHAFEHLISQKLIEIETKSKIPPQKDFIRITVKGTTRVIQKRLPKTVDEAKISIEEVERRVIEQIEGTKKYVDDVKKDVILVKKEFKTEQNRFYAKLIEIFGIFVAIFSFIIVGFNQYCCMISKDCSVTENLAYIVTIFLLLVSILLILLWAIGRVVKSITKSNDVNTKPQKPKDDSPTSKILTNWFIFSVFCFATILELGMIGILFRIENNLYWLGIQAFAILAISLIISYSIWYDKLKKTIWNAPFKYMMIILLIQFIVMLAIAYLTLKSLGTI